MDSFVNCFIIYWNIEYEYIHATLIKGFPIIQQKQNENLHIIIKIKQNYKIGLCGLPKQVD